MKFPIPIFARKFLAIALAAMLVVLAITPAFAGGYGFKRRYYGFSPKFERIASFPVFLNTDEDSVEAAENETAAEIVAVSQDGNTLVYTSDSETPQVNFVNIEDPYHPVPDGAIQGETLGGHPTSVAGVDN